MKKRYTREERTLIFLMIFMFLSYGWIEQKKEKVQGPWYMEKIEAAVLMEKSMDSIKQERIHQGLKIEDWHDINKTGMIGVEWSPITTTLGALESKRTTINPDFAAVVVDMIKKAGLKEGDPVAVNLSGSFPALNLAVLCAVETLDLQPVVISSIGASSWGANIPEFTYGDMEEFLFQNKILSNKSRVMSIGGAEDIGKDMDDEVVSKIVERMKGYQRDIIFEPNFSENIRKRISIYYAEGRDIKLFINVGGNIVSTGRDYVEDRIKPGLIMDYSIPYKNTSGLVQYFLSNGIPVIHLLDVKKIASDYGLPIDSYPSTAIGEGAVYFQEKYSKGTILLVLGIACMILFKCRKRKWDYEDC